MSNEYAVAVEPGLRTPLPAASPSSVGFSTERLNRIDPAMQAEIDAGHYAGISVMVARHGKLVKSGSNRCVRRIEAKWNQECDGDEPVKLHGVNLLCGLMGPYLRIMNCRRTAST